MPEVRTYARPVAAPRITPSTRLLRQVLEQAMTAAIIAIGQYIRDEARSPVPVYEPRYYRYPRKKGKTRQLLLSGRVAQTSRGYGLEISWKTPYAKYLIEKGRAGLARARKPGTTLRWPGIIRRTAVLVFLSKLRSLANRHGIALSRYTFLTSTAGA